jgi:hypothetical protein
MCVTHRSPAPPRSLNSTITTAFDVPGTLTALRCVNTTLSSLPNVSVAVALLASMQATATAVQSVAGTLSTAVGTLSTRQTAASAAISSVNADLAALASTLGSAVPVASASTDNMARAGVLLSDLVGSPSGLAVTVSADLATVPRTDAGGTFPTVALLQAASGVPADTTTPGTLNRLVSRGMDGNAAEIGTLVTRLQVRRGRGGRTWVR